MRRIQHAIVITWFMSLFLAPDAYAVVLHGSIQISNQAANKGSITCSGTYTVDTGWSVTNVTLYAQPTVGGLQSKISATYGGGNWGSATISGLTSGTEYTVWATVTVTDGTNEQTAGSATTKLKPT